MKIVHVSAGLVRIPPKLGGGTEYSIFNLASQLARLGNDVTILDRVYGKFEKRVNFYGDLKIIRLPSLQMEKPIISGRANPFINELIFGMRSKQFLSKIGFQGILHVHNIFSGSCIAARRRRSKIFYTCHSPLWAVKRLSIYERFLFKPLEFKLMKKADRIVVLSKFHEEKIISEVNLSKNKVILLPNGINIEEFENVGKAEGIAKRFGLEGTKIILYVGRISKIKGIHYLVDSADIIINKLKIRGIKFVMVGPKRSHFTMERSEGSYFKSLKSLIRQRNLEDFFLFTGVLPLNDKNKFYGLSDVVVLPSLGEGHPITLLEAMASGKPLIGSPVGGIHELIKDNWNGFLVNPTNVKELAEKILYILNDKRVSERFGRNSKQLASKEFSWEVIAKRMMQVYNET